MLDLNSIRQVQPEANDHSPCCRFCDEKLHFSMIDLGISPLCQNQNKPDELTHMEPFFPLKVYVCDQCFLVQLEEFVAPEDIFSGEYAYFSSYSSSWVAHAKDYVEMMIQRFSLGPNHLIMEIASNDGYLLQHFVHHNIPCLGIEPATKCAEAAKEKGVESIAELFGIATANKVAQDYAKPDLLLGNNILAHVPDINDFVGGMKKLLNDKGVITMEFPHLYQLMKCNQFDTIYHEHFSYLSFFVVEKIFAHHGLTIFDVEEIPTHGGSIRIFARHTENDMYPVSERTKALRQHEIDEGLMQLDTYRVFEENVRKTKRNILKFLIEATDAGKSIVGYGAPGKGNTLLNYCGIRKDFLDYTVDRNPHKAGTFTPGTHIPIFYPEKIKETKPDYVFILPWNLKKEIVNSMSFIREWGGKFVVPIPEIEITE